MSEPVRRVATFTIERRAVLAPDGHLLPGATAPSNDRERLVDLYRGMVRARLFDVKAIALQRTGRLGTYASSLGEEAVAVGVAAAMRPHDVLLPSFREHGAQLWRGVTPVELLLYWGGDERGSDFAGPREDFPVSVPVGSHAPHAAGVALAFRLRAEARVAVCVFGDGATSRGDVAEALNLAGALRLPAVFVIANNGWAISTPRTRQSAAETLAQKAIAAGMPGVQVDGNDVLGVLAAVSGAIERARGGGGPALIEALTYRLGDHTTADDARRYRDDAEVSARWQEEPIARMRSYLATSAGWTRDEEERLQAACRDEIEAAAEAYLATPVQPGVSMFDSLYATLPRELQTQRAEIARRAGEAAAND